LLLDDHMAQLLEQARSEAFEAGRREGFAAGRADLGGAAGRVEAALAAAARDLTAMRDAAVHETIEAAMAIAEFVLGRAPHDDGTALARRITEALPALDDDELAIAVHPQDWDAVGEAVQLPPGVTIVRDPALRPGEARISGRWSQADFTREAALAVAREALS
jgi:flagellar biosynthesis/type III secretory pathway protein FliH